MFRFKTKWNEICLGVILLHLYSSSCVSFVKWYLIFLLEVINLFLRSRDLFLLIVWFLIPTVTLSSTLIISCSWPVPRKNKIRLLFQDWLAFAQGIGELKFHGKLLFENGGTPKQEDNFAFCKVIINDVLFSIENKLCLWVVFFSSFYPGTVTRILMIFVSILF